MKLTQFASNFWNRPYEKKTPFFLDIQDLKDSQLFFNENLQCGDFVLSDRVKIELS